jgi:LysM repeat protein
MPRHATTLIRVLVTLSTIVVMLVLLLPSTGRASDRADTAVHVVEPGDTLWGIASSTGEGDPRDLVVAIMQLNDLDGSTIFPGQELVVPSGGG